jgi:hypothetical protein
MSIGCDKCGKDHDEGVSVPSEETWCKECAEKHNIQSPDVLPSELSGLLVCPLCGCADFDMSENTDERVASIYCNDCPYGVEDSTMTLAELRIWHNTRAN